VHRRREGNGHGLVDGGQYGLAMWSLRDFQSSFLPPFLFSSPFSVINSEQTFYLLSYNIVGVEGKPRRTRVFFIFISMLAEHVIECWNNMYKTWIPTFSFLGVLLRITIWHFFFLTWFCLFIDFEFFLKNKCIVIASKSFSCCQEYRAIIYIILVKVFLLRLNLI